MASTIPNPQLADITERAGGYPQVSAKSRSSEDVTVVQAERLLEEALKFMEVAAFAGDPVAPSRSCGHRVASLHPVHARVCVALRA